MKFSKAELCIAKDCKGEARIYIHYSDAMWSVEKFSTVTRCGVGYCCCKVRQGFKINAKSEMRNGEINYEKMYAR